MKNASATLMNGQNKYLKYTTNHSQTPYIHMFINHLPDLIAANNSFNDINQKGIIF